MYSENQELHTRLCQEQCSQQKQQQQEPPPQHPEASRSSRVSMMAATISQDSGNFVSPDCFLRAPQQLLRSSEYSEAATDSDCSSCASSSSSSSSSSSFSCSVLGSLTGRRAAAAALHQPTWRSGPYLALAVLTVSCGLIGTLLTPNAFRERLLSAPQEDDLVEAFEGWQCSHPANTQESSWCQSVGIHSGWQYKYFGQGDWCCHRSVTGSPPSVILPSGATVTGCYFPNKGPDDATVTAYFSIHYATARRFGAPRPKVYRAGSTIDGTIMNKPCAQEDHGVEDCLSLAIYMPTGDIKPNRDVMVWIHGGNYVYGSIKEQSGYFNTMVNRGDLIIVAIQYRLGGFGFWQPEEEWGVPANRGTRDQIEALRWVQSNIHAFGGNPASVTIAGQSAGGRSVVTLYQSPLAKGLFHRAIAQSPGYESTLFQVSTKTAARSMSPKCMKALNCYSLECMQRVPAKQFVSKCRSFFTMTDIIPSQGLYFSGYDGEVLPHPLDANLCEGVPAASGDVPIMVGGMAHEWRAFADFSPWAMANRFLWENLEGYREASHGVESCEVKQFLSNWTDWVQSATDQYSLGVGFVLQGAANRYRYLVDIEGAGGQKGSAHGGDVALLSRRDLREYSSTQAFQSEAWSKLSYQMIDYWITFAKTGVPSAKGGASWSPVDLDIAPAAPWGLPVLVFNYSAPEPSTLRTEIENGDRQQRITDILCRRTSLRPPCGD